MKTDNLTLVEIERKAYKLQCESDALFIKAEQAKGAHIANFYLHQAKEKVELQRELDHECYLRDLLEFKQWTTQRGL